MAGIVPQIRYHGIIQPLNFDRQLVDSRFYGLSRRLSDEKLDPSERRLERLERGARIRG